MYWSKGHLHSPTRMHVCKILLKLQLNWHGYVKFWFNYFMDNLSIEHISRTAYQCTTRTWHPRYQLDRLVILALKWNFNKCTFDISMLGYITCQLKSSNIYHLPNSNRVLFPTLAWNMVLKPNIFLLGWLPTDKSSLYTHHISCYLGYWSELGVIFINAKEGRMMHLPYENESTCRDPPPIYCNNSTAASITNNTIKRQCSCSVEMYYLLTMDQVEHSECIDRQQPR